MDTPHVLPVCTVQPDFEVSVNDVLDGIVPEESFWLSCYQLGESSVHGKVALTLNAHDRNKVDYAGIDGVAFRAGSEPHAYFASCEERGIADLKVVVPAKSFADPLPQTSKGVYQKISAFDVAPDGSQFATGYGDGSVYLISTSADTGAHSVARRCHLSTVTSVRFFPSSRVLLTAGLDFSLSILPADIPAPSSSEPTRITAVRILKGHTRGVTATAIIARGRTVLSASKDATLRLWDVSSGTQIRMLSSKNFNPIQAASAGEQSESSFTPPPHGEGTTPPVALDPREVETEGKVVYCALQNGTVEAFDLGTKRSVFRSSPTVGASSLESICYSPAHLLLATGSLNGIVSVYDTRSLASPLVKFTRNTASVEDLAFVSGNDEEIGLAIAAQDGLSYIANVRPQGPSVRTELIGTECDAVRCIRAGPDEGDVWTAGDDGIVRRYTRLNCTS